MSVFEKPQEPVVVQSDSQLPLPQPVAQYPDDVAMVDDTENGEAITHPTQKDDTTIPNFKDSGFFDGCDEHHANDEVPDISSGIDIDADNDAFTPADEIDTTNADLQDIPAEPVQSFEEINCTSNNADADSHTTPAEPSRVPIDGERYDEWQELGDKHYEQETFDEHADAESSNRKSKRPQPTNAEMDIYIKDLAQNDPDNSSKVDRANFALLDRSVPFTGLSAGSKGKGVEDAAESGDAGYIDSAENFLDGMSETLNGAHADEYDPEWDDDVNAAFVRGMKKARQGNERHSPKIAVVQPASKPQGYWVKNIEDDVQYYEGKSRTKMNTKKAIYWFEEDVSDSGSDSDNESDSDVDMDRDSDSDAGQSNSHDDTSRQRQSSSTRRASSTKGTTAIAISKSSGASSAGASHRAEVTLREKVDAIANTLWKRNKSCELAEATVATIGIESQLSRYTEEELQGHVNAFLYDNSGYLRPYMAVVRIHKTDENKRIKYIALSEAWHSLERRVELCGALKWILALLQKSAPGIREIDEELKVKLLALQPVWTDKCVEPEGIEKGLAAARQSLDMSEDPKSSALLDNDAAWQKHHDELEAIKNSNEKRNDLLQRTGISEKIIKMFKKLIESAEVLAADSEDLFEDTSNELLSDTLWRILDIVRFNDCNWRFPDMGAPECTEEDKKQNAMCFDYLHPECPYPDDHARKPYTGVARDEAGDDEQFPNDWKGAFPPSILSSLVSKRKIYFHLDSVLDGRPGLSVKRMATVKSLDAPTFNEWISTYTDRVDDFRESMEAIVEELDRLNSNNPKSLVHRANGSLKYVAVHSPVEARKRLMEKQLWFRNYFVLVLRRIRKIVEVWISEPNRVETEDMATLLQRIKDSEIRLLTIQSNEAVTYPWIVKYCLKVNRPEGCPLGDEGLCPYSHSEEGKLCPSIKLGNPCTFGDQCHKSHTLKPYNIRTTFPGETSGPSPGQTQNTARGYCLKVNKLGGCNDTKCSFSHANKGVPCRNGESCTWGEGCAYVHSEIDATTLQRSAPGNPMINKNTDLKPLLDQVLVNPKRFRVCSWANNFPVNCMNENCPFNHTLEGVECPDYNLGNCPRQTMKGGCFLMHKQPQSFNQQQRSAAPQSSKRSRDDSGFSELQLKRTRPNDSSQTASPMTPAYSAKLFMPKAGQNDQQGSMQMQSWPTHGQQNQQQQGRQPCFNAPTAPRAAQNQQMHTPQSPVPNWPAQYPQSPQQFMNGMWATSPTPQPYMAPPGPAQAQRFNQQPKPQPLLNAPKGPQQNYQAQPAHGPLRNQQHQALQANTPLLRPQTTQVPQVHAHAPQQKQLHPAPQPREFMRQQSPYQAPQARAHVPQQQQPQAPRGREPICQQPLYQAPQARAPMPQTQCQVPKAPAPTSGFSIRGAAGPNQQAPPAQNPRTPPAPRIHQQPLNRRRYGGGRKVSHSGDENRDIEAGGQAPRISGRHDYSRKQRKQDVRRKNLGQGQNP